MSEDLGVRIGTPEDVHPMMELALQACEENGFVDPNPQKLLAEIWPALNEDNGLVGIIQDEGGNLEGAILLRIGTMWYSDTPVLEEKAIFVNPNFRGAKGGRARRLCEFSKKAADALGLPLIIGVLSNHRTEAKIRLYERQFGKPSGAFFLYNAQTGAIGAAAE
jgi:GNAT superfamily N-acetyltransferase